MTKQTTTTKQTQKRESDGRFALQLNSKRARQRDWRRQMERDQRKEELIAKYGDEWDMWA